MGLGRGCPGRPGGPALPRRRLPRRLAPRFPAVRRAPLPCLQGQDRRARLPAGTGAPVPCRARRRDRQLPRVAGRGHEPASIAFGGESIGGGTLALAALPAVRESGLPLPASAFALSPLTDLTLNSPAISDPGGRDPLARDGRQFAEAVRDYLPPGQDPAAPLVSPLYAAWSGLPAVHIEVGSTERLIDDARRLIE